MQRQRQRPAYGGRCMEYLEAWDMKASSENVQHCGSCHNDEYDERLEYDSPDGSKYYLVCCDVAQYVSLAHPEA